MCGKCQLALFICTGLRYISPPLELIASGILRLDPAMSNVVIVVPCYNEADRLDVDAFLSFAAEQTSCKFLLVNDGSRDATLEVLERLQVADCKSFEVYDLPHNMGKAEAVRHGFLKAMNSSVDYVGFWDADLATPLEDIQNFTQVLDCRPDIEIVIGTRIPLLGRSIQRKPIRRFLGCIFAGMASRVLGMRIFDTQCGAKVFRVSEAMRKVFEKDFITRWIFDVEILARIIRARRGTQAPQVESIVYEMPVERWEDVAGSKLKKGDFVKAVLEMASIYWCYLRPWLPPAASGKPTDLSADSASEFPAEQEESKRAA